jgi:hypothetical protein
MLVMGTKSRFMFMSKKMKESMIVLKYGGKIEELVAKECIPEKFGKLEGCMKEDLVVAKYFS